MRFLYLAAAISAAICTIATPVQARPQREQSIELHQQLAKYYHADGVIKSIGKAASRTIYSSNPRKRHKWKRAVRWLISVRAEARARINALRAPAWPAHHALWTCLLRYEGGRWDNQNTGGNGHWGGLQMHPGWGYGTAYHASDSPQIVQELAAEHAYRDSGYSSSFLTGQWGQTISNCWAYAR